MDNVITKSNHGTILALPEICVNRFGLFKKTEIDWHQSKIFFLTHYDKEILSDVLHLGFLNFLKNGPANGPRLFLHEHMFKFLRFWCEHPLFNKQEVILDLLEELRTLKKIICCQTNKSIVIHSTFNNRKIVATMLASGYDIGCVMLHLAVSELEEIRDSNGDCMRILYTGNCRFSLKDLKMANSPCLYDEAGVVLPISKLYLDTSYLYKEIFEVPLRGYITRNLVDALKSKLDVNEKFRFEISSIFPGTLGHLCYELAEELHEPVHVPEPLNRFFSQIPDMCHRSTCRNDETLHLHYCCDTFEDNGLCTQGLDWDVDVDVSRLNLWREVFPLRFLPYPEEYMRHTLVFLESNNVRVCDAIGLPRIYHEHHDDLSAVYCSHLSRYEIGRFISYLSIPITADSIFPLYMPKNRSLTNVLELLEETVEQENLPNETLDYSGEPYASTYDRTFISRNHVGRQQSTTTETFLIDYDGEQTMPNMVDDEWEELANRIAAFTSQTEF